ncbi:MAG: bacillithiol system redox-active protein YtxJ [Candidatus Krumholzibacteriia bacterium]
MTHELLELPGDASEAVEALREASRLQPVLVFKKSPICPVSAAAEQALQGFLSSRRADDPLQVAVVDVLAERSLARGLASELGIRHESPQALFFADGELQWHGSHWDLTTERFASVVDRREAGG